MYLVKRPGGWYDLRVRIPVDLIGQLGKSDLSVSLETRSKRQAKRVLPVYRDRYHQCFEMMRRDRRIFLKELDQQAIRSLVRSYVKDQIELQTLKQAMSKPLSDDAHLDELEGVEFGLSMEREALGTRNHVKFMGIAC